MQKPGPKTNEFFRTVLRAFNEWNVPFLVGGGYAMSFHTATKRPIRDLDLFVLPSDFDRALERFDGAGFLVERLFPHWLGKIYKGRDYVDVIFSSGNGVAAVDETWFEHASQVEVLDVPVRVNPVEEMIWDRLVAGLDQERRNSNEAGRVCRGALLSRGQFLGDLEQGFRDPRLVPEGSMTSRDVAVWTEAAKQSEDSP